MKSYKFIYLTIFIFYVFNSVKSQNLLKYAVKDKIVKKLTPILENSLIKKNLKLGSPVFFRILKKTDKYPDFGELEIWVKNTDEKTFSLFKKYPICYYSGGLGTKKKQGDGKTPEGFYFVNSSRINQYSSYHRSFNIGYPNSYEKKLKYTGSYLMIHGACCSVGCIAMTDEYIEEIWTIGIKALQNGQKFFRVHIFPFHMTEKNMKEYYDKNNMKFWRNLKEGYDFFQKNYYPPNVAVKNFNYIFE